MRSFVEAKKQLRKVGAAHAQGDALKAMYAELLVVQHGGNAVKYYEYLQASADSTEKGIRAVALPLMRDRAKAWDVLMGIVVPS